MNLIHRETAIESLRDLESHYQAKYEHYLAMATQAKENKERVGLLMQDLLKDVSYLEHQSSVSVSADWELPQFKQEQKSARISDEQNLLDDSAQLQSQQIQQWFQSLSKVIDAIEYVCNLDSGKSLHRSYLHKILNRELEQELSIDIVDLYLDEAVNRGVVKRDEFDNQCYIACSSNVGIENDNDLGSKNEPSKRFDKEVVEKDKNVSQTSVKNEESDISSVSTRKNYNLPKSNKLKPTLLETIEYYFAKCNPKQFTIEDVMNYLYPQKQQLGWSSKKKNKVRSCISNVLGRKAYRGEYWERIKPGVYQPLYDYDLN